MKIIFDRVRPGYEIINNTAITEEKRICFKDKIKEAVADICARRRNIRDRRSDQHSGAYDPDSKVPAALQACDLFKLRA